MYFFVPVTRRAHLGAIVIAALLFRSVSVCSLQQSRDKMEKRETEYLGVQRVLITRLST